LLQPARVQSSAQVFYFLCFFSVGLLTNGSKDSPLDGQHWSVTVGCQCTQRVARPPAFCPFLRFLSLSLPDSNVPPPAPVPRTRARTLLFAATHMLPRRRSLSLSLSPLWNFCEDPDPWMYNYPLHPLSVSSALRFEFFSRFFFFNFRFFSFFHRSRDPF